MDPMTCGIASGLDYPSIVAASERVAWTVDEIFGDRRFDASRPLVPASWVGTQALGFLGRDEQRTLNHCRAFSYVHLIGNFEEFVPFHMTGLVQRDARTDRAQARALLRFGEEEVKHQQLFHRAERVLEQSCGHPFARYFDDDGRAGALAEAILDHSPLARFLVLLALEWGTQRHYVESVRDRTDAPVDPLYVEILRAHWVEEAQHTKSDTLEIARLTRELGAEERRTAFDHLAAIGAMVDAALAGQVEAEIATLREVSGRTFSTGEVTALRGTLSESLRAIIMGVALGHPRFASVAVAVSAEGAASLGIAA